jgi:class 3 adenylate cyclase/ABC-type dipeptide/oligopeptide/nickel transport system ATPase component
VNCPKCQFENPEDKKFCGRCGTKMESICPSCKSANPPDFQFCGDCGHRLEAEPPPKAQPLPPSDSARKHVTVLFSDMSGYTSMTEKLDPEETKEIMGKIFGEISKVVAKYGGFIEKFIGDAVMALFGVPTAHEDDPVRAIKASREIHDVVSSLSTQFEKRIGKPLDMHTGICTGLVVTGEVNLEKGTHGVLGDTINTAARLSGLAKPGEIVISPDTYHQAEGYFNFEALEPTTVKGKAEPIKTYRVISPKDDPTKTHRLSGMRAELIGRKVEMAQLQEAVTNLKQGKGSIFSIVGDAGTGKSRLIEDFKASINLEEVQWREGHAYAYSQNIPYFPLIDLLSRAWQITDGDNLEQVKKKVETGAGYLISDKSELIPYLGSLYSIKYPEIEDVSPEYWKARLHEAIQLILANLCKRSPTIICIEDLHWADPSSVELLRNILSGIRYPAIFLCIYRPTFSLFTSHQATTIKTYREIKIQDLSPGESQDMVESLLKSKDVPPELKKFIQTKIEGNPFYLEEVINSLLETAALIQQDDKWLLTKSLTEANIPSTVQGVISARLDRLERETKRILQEASVIGRAFLYEILKRISNLKEYIDKSLITLERLDLIKTISLQPELEYIFKHVLTQEVVYNGLLMKERRLIHESIGKVIEELYQDRLEEFYEMLAYHYSRSDNRNKAVHYLKLSGNKSIRNNALWEAYNFYKEAIGILRQMPESEQHKKEQIETIFLMTVPTRLLGYPEDSIDFLKEGEMLCKGLGDRRSLANLYNFMNLYYSVKGDPAQSRKYQEETFMEADKIQDIEIMTPCGYGLCFSYIIDGNFVKLNNIAPKVIALLEKTQRENEFFGMHGNPHSMLHVFYGFALGGVGEFAQGEQLCKKGIASAHRTNHPYSIGTAYLNYGNFCMFKWDGEKVIKIYQSAIEYQEKSQSTIFLGMSWGFQGVGYYMIGEHDTAIKLLEKGIKMQTDMKLPFMISLMQVYFSMVHFDLGNLDEANTLAEQAVKLAQTNREKMAQGFAWLQLGRTIGRMEGSQLQKAEECILNGIKILKELKIKPNLSIGFLFLGELYAHAGRKENSLKLLKQAEGLFQAMGINYWLGRTKNILESLKI